MTNYQVTIGYKACISVNIKANNEADAKRIAVEMMSNQKDKMFKKDGF